MGGVTKCSRNTIFFSSAYTGWGSYIMHEKHDRTAESHAGVLGQKKNFFSSFTYTGWWGSYIMHEKHDRTAESHAGVPGQIKKNFFSSFTYTGWGGVILCL